MKAQSPRTPRPPRARRAEYVLRLYVAGRSVQSGDAIRNLEALCAEHLAGRYQLEVIDILARPRLAKDEQIVAVPTLIRRLPPPLRRIIGDLSDSAAVLVGLDLRPGRDADAAP